MFEDREYQRIAIENARALIARGVRRFILQAPTGSGKTILSGMIAKGILEKNKRIVFAAHRRELVLQPRLKFIDMGIPASAIGVIKAGEKKLHNASAPIQIVSIQSVHRRSLPPADVLFIDECHLARAAMYEWLLEQYPEAWVIGLTATPQRLDGKPLRTIFDEILVVALPSQLIAAGHIVAPRMFTVPDHEMPDLSDVGHLAGDFNEKDLHKAVTKREVMGSIPDHWGRRARGLRTICFAVTIEHSKALVDLMVGFGIRAVHVDGSSPQKVREEALAALKAGTIDVVSQVGLWVEGLDVPELKCAIFARPTESLVVHLQSSGRLVRPWNDLTPIILDHAGNCRRHGPPTKDWVYSLDGRRKREKSDVSEERVRVCPECHEIIDASMEVCPGCGKELGRNRSVTHRDDVELVELAGGAEEDKKESVLKQAFERFWQVAYRDGHDESWVIRRYAEKYGDAPPTDWKAPERPQKIFSVTEKHKELARFNAIASRQNLPASWIEKKYFNKFGEPLSLLSTLKDEEPKPVERKPVQTDDKVDLEF